MIQNLKTHAGTAEGRTDPKADPAGGDNGPRELPAAGRPGECPARAQGKQKQQHASGGGQENGPVVGTHSTTPHPREQENRHHNGARPARPHPRSLATTRTAHLRSIADHRPPSPGVARPGPGGRWHDRTRGGAIPRQRKPKGSKHSGEQPQKNRHAPATRASRRPPPPTPSAISRPPTAPPPAPLPTVGQGDRRPGWSPGPRTRRSLRWCWGARTRPGRAHARPPAGNSNRETWRGEWAPVGTTRAPTGGKQAREGDSGPRKGRPMDQQGGRGATKPTPRRGQGETGGLPAAGRARGCPAWAQGKREQQLGNALRGTTIAGHHNPPLAMEHKRATVRLPYGRQGLAPSQARRGDTMPHRDEEGNRNRDKVGGNREGHGVHTGSGNAHALGPERPLATQGAVT